MKELTLGLVLSMLLASNRAQGPIIVSGYVAHSVLNTGLAGVTLNGFPGPTPVQTQPDGSFAAAVPLGWSATVTPSRPGFVFNPASRIYSNLTQNPPSQLFVAQPTLPPTHFYVDGANGSNTQDGLTPATAWATLTHAMRTLMPAGTGHTLHVAGNHVYGPGETFPLDLPPDVTILGDGAIRPALLVPSGTIGVRSVSSQYGVTARTDHVRRLHFTGTGTAIVATMTGAAHGMEVDGCRFSNSGTGVRCHNSGTAWSIPPFQSFVSVHDSEFEGVAAAIQAQIDMYGSSWRFTTERCAFRNVSGVAIQSGVGWRDDDNRPQVIDCTFQDVATGVWVYGGSSPLSSSSARIANCRFSRCGTTGVLVNAGADSLNGFLIESCAFGDCACAIDLRLSGSNPVNGGYHYHIAQDNFFLRCSTGLAASFQQSFTDWLVLDRNRYELCGVGADIQSGQLVQITSTREVYLDNTTGLLLHGQGGGTYGGNAWKFVLRDAILARNTMAGCQLNASGSVVECSGLTVADNGAFGMLTGLIDQTSTISHCIFDNAGPGLASATSVSVTWSCFVNQTVPGVGNMNANPQLFRPYYKLSSSSPCVDAGNPAATLTGTDYEGDARIIGTVCDIGADEFTPAGTVRPFGLRGLAAGGLSPSISSSNATVRVGAPLLINLANASNVQAALLLMGTGESSTVYPRELENYGAFGSFAWIEPGGVLSFTGQVTGGAANAQLQVPNAMWLVGWVATFQWLVLTPGANAAGMVTTQGLRATIGA